MQEDRRNHCVTLLVLYTGCVIVVLIYRLHSKTGGLFMDTAYVRQTWTIKPELSLNLNHIRYNALTTPDSCSHPSDIFMIIYIHSDPAHLEKRMLIRTTWGNSDNYMWLGKKVKTIFILGLPKNQSENTHTLDAILDENIKFKDLLLIDFSDAYTNLTYKALSAMKHVSYTCREARYVLKADDDMFVNIFKLVDHLASHDIFNTSTILCHVWKNARIVRDKSQKWYVSTDQYPSEHYPDYCSGSAYVTTTSVLKQLCRVSKDVSQISIDDVYVTGILRENTNVTLTVFNEHYRLFRESLRDTNCYEYYFMHQTPTDTVKKLWRGISEISFSKRSYSNLNCPE